MSLRRLTVPSTCRPRFVANPSDFLPRWLLDILPCLHTFVGHPRALMAAILGSKLSAAGRPPPPWNCSMFCLGYFFWFFFVSFCFVQFNWVESFQLKMNMLREMIFQDSSLSKDLAVGRVWSAVVREMEVREGSGASNPSWLRQIRLSHARHGPANFIDRWTETEGGRGAGKGVLFTPWNQGKSWFMYVAHELYYLSTNIYTSRDNENDLNLDSFPCTYTRRAVPHAQ